MTSEIKFLVEPSKAAEIIAWARDILPPDPYGGGPHGDRYEISSLYFDTPERDVFHRRGSYGRSKYRVRRYQSAEAAFLERKLKTGDLVGKTRSLVPLAELIRLEEQSLPRAWAGWWFQRRLQARRLQVVSQITYLRTARAGIAAGGPVRLTVDENIRARETSHLAFEPDGGGRLLLGGKQILELKFKREMPAMFKELVRLHGLCPQPVSKYRMAAQNA